MLVKDTRRRYLPHGQSSVVCLAASHLLSRRTPKPNKINCNVSYANSKRTHAHTVTDQHLRTDFTVTGDSETTDNKRAA